MEILQIMDVDLYGNLQRHDVGKTRSCKSFTGIQPDTGDKELGVLICIEYWTTFAPKIDPSIEI